MLEAKLYLHENIYVRIMTEFVANKDSEAEKQDRERKAAKRLMKRLKEQFPMLLLLFCADSLYACESVFEPCRKYHYTSCEIKQSGQNCRWQQTKKSEERNGFCGCDSVQRGYAIF